MSLILLIGLSGYLGYRLTVLNKAHQALTQDFERLTHRAALLKKKYTAQKAQTSALQRAKLAVEGLKRKAEMKAEALAKQLERQKAEMAVIEKKIGTKIKVLEARIAENDNTIAQWKEKHGTLTKAFQQAKKTIAERDGTIAKMEENIQELEAELQFSNHTRDRYLADNRKMAKTAQSILARYDEKGVFATSIIHVEPFTQIKKVELEQLIQEYLDQIDDHTVRDNQ